MPLLQSVAGKALFLLFVAALVCTVPYLFPVARTISLSYITGFNNKVAIVLFAGGVLVFAVLTRGRLSSAFSERDTPLTLRSLGWALAVVLAACLVRLLPLSGHVIGAEASYALNRLEMLVAGHRPYLGFEYAYGPAHLYVPLLFSKLFAMSPLRGFYLWWVVQWLVGTAMLWFVLRRIDLPLEHRGLIFGGLLLMESPNILAEGTAYTPVRMIGSAFWIVVVHWAWTRKRSPLLVAIFGVVAVGIAMSISSEQATGVAAGLLCWFALLTFRRPRTFSFAALILFVFALAALIATGSRFGLFLSAAEFAKGAYAYPILPSPTLLLLLFVYVAAGCALVRVWLAGGVDSMILPLAIGGCAMLPAALSRCDWGHLQIAAPAFLLGVAAIESQPGVRRWWTPLAILLVMIPGLSMFFYQPLKGVLQHRRTISNELGTVEAPAAPSNLHAPCREIYVTPVLWPSPNQTAAEACLETGYYKGVYDVLDEAGVQHKIADLERSPRSAMLLFDRPVGEQFAAWEIHPEMLHRQELVPFAPKARNAPLSYQPLVEYILANYTPDAEPLNGRRVWRRKGSAR